MYNRIQSYASDFDTLRMSKAGEALTASTHAPAAAKEDDDVDLFSSDQEADEEAERMDRS